MGTDLVEETVGVAGRRLTIVRPRRPEDLIDEHEFAEDEFLPYWAELWPSAMALAEVVGTRQVAGRRVLELGCGLAVPSLVAAAAGADVLATDWSSEAVRRAVANARLNGLQLSTAVWRWTDDPAPLAPPFDVVLGADLLYERRNCPWLLAALPRLVRAGSEVWLADPGRAAAAGFFERAPETFALEPMSHAGPAGVTVHRLALRAA